MSLVDPPHGATTADSTRELVYGWPYLEWGGAQIYFLNLMRAAAADFRVRSVLPAASSPSLLAYLAAEPVRIELFDAHTDDSNVRGIPGRIRRRWRKRRAENAFRRHLLRNTRTSAILHVDIAPWSSYGLLARLARRNHTFVTLHTRLPSASGLRRRLWTSRWRRLARLPDFHLLAANRDVRDSLALYLDASMVREVPVAYSGVDLQEIDRTRADPSQRARLLHRLGVPSDRILVTAAGQFIDRKGRDTFLEAAAMLERLDAGLFFLWLGTDPLTAAEKRRIDAAGLRSFRYVPADESGRNRESFLASLDALTDIFALPSRLEGLPLVLVEIMAMGKPVVASAVNAVPEAITDGDNGLLVRAADPQGLADALARVAADKNLAGRLGEAARVTAVERFDQRRTSETTLTAYRRALQRSVPSPPRQL